MIIAPPSASALLPTGCQFLDRTPNTDRPQEQGPGIEKLGLMALARDRGDSASALGHARDAAGLIAGYRPRTIEMLLDVTARLSEGAISRAAATALARELLKIFDPISRQTAETDATALGAYLRARRHVQLADGSDARPGLFGIQKRIDQSDICPECKFFLHLRLTREFGARLGRTVVRPRLEDLWRRVDGLKGVGEGYFPMQWIARHQLTAAAVEFKLFDLAETWLAVVELEVATLLRSKAIDAETRLSIKEAILNFPLYVATRAGRYRRQQAAGLD